MTGEPMMPPRKSDGSRLADCVPSIVDVEKEESVVLRRGRGKKGDICRVSSGETVRSFLRRSLSLIVDPLFRRYGWLGVDFRSSRQDAK